mmetsp:Transcript_8810/g.21281  ORF Transcript_8810/g.21281 Transcript_8810/m.21281 type:complete len:215 (-) Transcript_8810:285-929(-)
MALRHDSAKRAAAYAIESVADPPPAFASTTSVPAFWMRLVRSAAAESLSLGSTGGWDCESSGRMVAPAWPPTTGTETTFGFTPTISETNLFARTTSSVVTPKSFFGLYFPAFLRTSAAMGTVEFTGFEMTPIRASGQWSATPCTRVRTIPALMLKRSSRVMPGLRGTPAGMITRSQPFKQSPSSASPQKPATLPAPMSQWDRSHATPFTIGATS